MSVRAFGKELKLELPAGMAQPVDSAAKKENFFAMLFRS